MSVGVLLITHGSFGDSLAEALAHVLGAPPSGLAVMAVDSDSNSEQLHTQAKAHLQLVDAGDGVIILTDLIGATPANLAGRLKNDTTRIVTGVNLSMLMRVMNYRHLSLAELAEKALTGGHDGIMELESDPSA